MSCSVNIIRIMVQDKGSPPILSDGEICALTADESNINRAAAIVARSMAAYYSNLVDSAIGKLKLSSSQKANNYYKMAADYDSIGKEELSGFYDDDANTIAVTGVSVSEMDAQNNDTDRVQGAFYRGINDYPGVDDPQSRDRGQG